MPEKEVLIYDPKRQVADIVAAEFQSLGWNVHKTHDEVEAGYRLLVWYDPAELPELAILDVPEPAGLLDFCTLLREEGIDALVSVIVLLDEAFRDTVGKFRQLGVIPVVKSDDQWSGIKAVVDQLRGTPASDTPGRETPSEIRRSDPPESALRERGHAHRSNPAKAVSHVTQEDFA